MNKVFVIKQNLGFIGKTWVKCMGSFLSILSIFCLFWNWNDIHITSTQHKCMIDNSIIVFACTCDCNYMDMYIKKIKNNLEKFIGKNKSMLF